jgi:regulator of replication initiation timing
MKVMENKKKSNKDIVVSLIIDNMLVKQNEKHLRESLSEEGLNPDEVLKEYGDKVDMIMKQVEENKKKIKKGKGLRP